MVKPAGLSKDCNSFPCCVLAGNPLFGEPAVGLQQEFDCVTQTLPRLIQRISFRDRLGQFVDVGNVAVTSLAETCSYTVVRTMSTTPIPEGYERHE